MVIQKSKMAAVYARVSGDKQKRDDTIESQLDVIRIYAKEKKYNIIDEWIFKDEAVTGKSLARPGLDALRDLAREGEPDIIIILEPDRLARKKCYQTLLLEEFESFGVSVEFVNCKKVAETPEEQLTIDILGCYAEFERTKIADRCRRGRIYKAKKGSLSVFPKVPYGFIRQKESTIFEIDEEKSKVVKEIFYLYAHAQYSLGAISKHLEEKGILTQQNCKKWDRTTLRDMLRNEAYIGTTYFGKTEKYEGFPNIIIRRDGKKITKSRNARRERSKDLWIPLSVPAIISENDFQIVQDRFEENKKFATRNTNKPSLLQGVLVCQECRRAYYKKKRGEIYYYCCSSNLQKNLPKCSNKSIRQNEFDVKIWEEVVNLLKSPDLLEQEIARRIDEKKQGKYKYLTREKIEKELSRLSNAQNKLLDAYQDGNCITLDELKKRTDMIKKKTDELEQELKLINDLEIQYENTVDIIASLDYLKKRLDNSTELALQEKQKIIRLLIDEIVIDKESIKIKHCIPLNNKFGQNSPLRGACFITA